MASTLELELIGGGGEPVDLRRTISSHGLAALPPFEPLDEGRALRVTIPLGKNSARTVTISQKGRTKASIDVAGRAPGAATATEITATVRRILGLDQDLSAFYARAADDPKLSWVAIGAGRMIRSPSVFEDVVKTICTTNCAWSATVRMVTALVEHLGARAAGAPASGWQGRAFPQPEAVAAAGVDFYKDVVRAGYRGPYLISLAESVAGGEVDLEALAAARPDELCDDDLARELQQLPGVGPYAAAHIMMMIGRHSRLILDSWTRPTYAAIAGRRNVKDSTIVNRFKRYGDHAGLAFWLFLTESWVQDRPSS